MNRKNIYKIEYNKYGAYFIKNHKYYYLDEFTRYGLNNKHWYNKIDYKIYNITFITIDNVKYIKCYVNYNYKYMW